MGRSHSEKGSVEIVKIDHTGALYGQESEQQPWDLHSGMRARGNLQGTLLEILASALGDLGRLEKASAPA